MENLTNNNGLQFFNATGVRQPKSVNENVVIAESTRASFKLMPAVCATLGIKDGDYVTMQMTKDESGVVNGVYIGKGKNAIPKTDAEGNVIRDERKRIVNEVEGYGALASELTPGTNILKISVASSWDVLGDTELKKHYVLADEPVTTSLPIGNGEFLPVVLYKLNFLKDEAKVVRTSKKDASAPVASADTQVHTETAEVAQEEAIQAYDNGSSEFDNNEF